MCVCIENGHICITIVYYLTVDTCDIITLNSLFLYLAIIQGGNFLIVSCIVSGKLFGNCYKFSAQL